MEETVSRLVVLTACVLGEFLSGLGLAMLAGWKVALLERPGLAQSGQLDTEGALHLELRAVAHLFVILYRRVGKTQLPISANAHRRFAKRQPV